MNKFHISWRAGFISVLFLFLIAAVAPADAGAAVKKWRTPPSQENNFTNPDFAYPETVRQNARQVFGASLKAGEYLTSLQAAVELTLAQNEITRDSVPGSLALFSELTGMLPAPYSSLAYLLKGRLLSEVYSSNRRNFNRRTLPADSLPEDPRLWDSAAFRREITGCVASALTSLPEESKTLPLDDFQGLIQNYSGASQEGYMLYDFVCYQSRDLLRTFGSGGVSSNIIPFTDKKGSLPLSSVSASAPDVAYVMESLANFHLAVNPQSVACGRALAARSDLLPREDKARTLAEYIRFLKRGGVLIPLLVDYANNFGGDIMASYPSVSADGQPEYVTDINLPVYDLALSLSEECKDLPAVKAVDDILGAMRSQGVAFSSPSRLLPGKEFKVAVANKNLKSGYLLVLRLPDSALRKSMKGSDIVASAKLAAAVPVPYDNTSDPFLKRDSLLMPSLDAGVYCLLPSSSDKIDGLVKSSMNRYVDNIVVSGIDLLSINDPRDGQPVVYVVDAATQAPVAGVSLQFYNNGKGSSKRGVTDADGKCKSPFRNADVVAVHGGNLALLNSWGYKSSEKVEKYLQANLLTDLSLYRPGQKLGFSAVVFQNEGARHQVVPSRNLTAKLFDANYQQVDSLTFTSDNFGRVAGEFTLPTEGLLGKWSVHLFDDMREIDSCFVEVAEYKAPTFFVSVDSVPESVNPGEMVEFSGKVMTYSGMPVAGSKVDYTIDYVPCWWWRYSADPASYGGSVETDAEGNFRISLPTAGLKDTRFEKGVFSIRATATSPAGESQESQARRFSLSKSYHINVPAETTLCVTPKSLRLSVPVLDVFGLPAVRQVDLSIASASGEVVARGCFDSPNIDLPASEFPSGRYTARYALDGDTVTQSLVVWRMDDRKPPVASSLWVPVKEYYAKEKSSTVKVKVGNSYSDGWILASLSGAKGVVWTKWIRPKGGVVEVDVPSPEKFTCEWLALRGRHDLKNESALVTIYPAEADVKLGVETVTFRDRIAPGDSESWKFRFLLDGKAPGVIPAMAVMSNKALDAIYPFSWDFGVPSYYPGMAVNFNSRGMNVNRESFPFSLYKREVFKFVNPDWNFFGMGGLYNGMDGGLVKYNLLAVRGANPMRRESGESNEVYAYAKEEAAMDAASPAPEAAGVTSEMSVSDEGGAVSDDVQFRSDECPLAFFRPDLTTDAQGNLSVDFTVPDFNTTWKLQLMGYTPDMKSAMTTIESVASKKVMVASQLPQFLRTGDRAVLVATLYNNSDISLPLGGAIEVFDPVSGDVLLSKAFADESVAPSANRVVSLEFNVPFNLSAVGVRSVARSGGSSDGEQSLLPVLPSSQPVVESDPFWLAPGQNDFSLTIPAAKDGANVTLQYCDNPAWYCLTALPDIVNPSSESVWSLSTALYGNCIGAGLINKYPALKQGLKLMLDSEAEGESPLVSPLEKDAALKIVALGSSPWVNSAKAETMRMTGLSSLLDEKGARRTVENIWNRMEKLRNSDGGWSWCPGMQSSLFMTTKVLTNLGMLRSMGYSPDVRDYDNVVRKAVAYCDSEILKEYRNDRKNFNYLSMLDYLYTRSFFSIPDAGGEFYTLRAKAISEIMKSWKKMDIYEKATAAILLHREGKTAEASAILASLEQFASYQPEKGRWFDNLSSSWSPYPVNITTAQALEAYTEIAPDSPMVDGLRQWLVLQRQIQDWGRNPNNAEVINAVLTSGSDWTPSSAPAEITLDGVRLQPSQLERLTGSFTMSLPADAAGKTLSVKRNSAGPAWGGVISQYVAPMTDIKAAGIPDLKISKAFYVAESDNKGKSAKEVKSFRKGDRVKVTLTIENNLNMEYVALVDERPACLTPAEFVSGYTATDGVWYYREVRTGRTTLFIPYLRKGKFVITYECFASEDGDYSAGIATVQSQYAPSITAHSAGKLLKVAAE